MQSCQFRWSPGFGSSSRYDIITVWKWFMPVQKIVFHNKSYHIFFHINLFWGRGFWAGSPCPLSAALYGACQLITWWLCFRPFWHYCYYNFQVFDHLNLAASDLWTSQPPRWKHLLFFLINDNDILYNSCLGVVEKWCKHQRVGQIR
jgi:hypothetical protein